jgi:hypothetical protein
MATRNEWNSYQVGSGINIWGNPEFKGSPVFAGGLEFGDAITDTLTLKGRVATGSVAGSELDIDANYTYSELVEIRAGVSSWSGVGGSFHGLYMRIAANIDATGKSLYAEELYAANADGIDIGTLQTFLFNTMGKGNSTITLMRGGEIKCEWLATDTVTNARALQIEFQGLAAPTNPVYGIYFEKESAAGAMAAMFYEIRMKSGMCILSGVGAPAMAAGKGSLYLRTDGSGVNDRAYINTDGSTTWTALTTAA